MAELGGPRPIESIEKVHPRRISPAADGGMFLNIVPDGESEPAGSIGVWWGEWQDTELWELGWMLLPQFHGRGLGSEALGPADRAPARARRSSTSSTPSPGSRTDPRTGSAASSASSSSTAARSSSPAGPWWSTTGPWTRAPELQAASAPRTRRSRRGSGPPARTRARRGAASAGRGSSPRAAPVVPRLSWTLSSPSRDQ